MGTFIDLTGKKFNRLTILSRAPNKSHPMWNVRCDCGTEKVVGSPHLRKGTTKSCGCLQSEVRRQNRNYLRKYGVTDEERGLRRVEGFLWCSGEHKAFLPSGDFHAPSRTVCKECTYLRHLRLTFKLTPVAYTQLISKQDGKCAICESAPESTFCVDHDHGCCGDGKTCGRCIRGLLCRECNTRLGSFESFLPEMSINDSTGWVRNALMYLSERTSTNDIS